MVPAQLQSRDSSGPCRTRTASPGSKWSLPDLNCKREIAVVPAGPEQQAQDQSGPAGPQLQARDRSGPCRTRTASPGSKWSLPDLNIICRIECHKCWHITGCFLVDVAWKLHFRPRILDMIRVVLLDLNCKC